jgi:hypothetical protein
MNRHSAKCTIAMRQSRSDTIQWTQKISLCFYDDFYYLAAYRPVAVKKRGNRMFNSGAQDL